MSSLSHVWYVYARIRLTRKRNETTFQSPRSPRAIFFISMISVLLRCGLVCSLLWYETHGHSMPKKSTPES